MLLDKFLSVAGASGSQPDAQFNYVTMLLHGDGTNGAQNNTFLDSSTNAFTITRNGNTTQGSFSPYGSNWSNYFDGTGDYLRITNSSQTGLGSGDFTVESWIYLSAVPSATPFAIVGNGERYYRLYVNSGSLQFWWRISATDYSLTSSAITWATNTWYHVAAVRNGTSITLYLNGTSVGTTTTGTSGSIENLGDIGVGGLARPSSVLSWPFNGYLSNTRLVVGTAVYTGNFTPSTTPLTAITNTSLLTCQSNRFVDNSTNNFTITVNGDTSVQRFNPFGTSTAYSTATIGGSGYFDGSGDYLSIANNSNLNLGAGDFTLEGWIYPNTASGAHIIWSQWNNGGDNATQLLQNGTAFVYRIGATQWTFGSGTVTVGAWMHIAVSRSGSTVRMFVNGAVSSTQTDSTDVTTTGATVIGANDTGATAANIFNGYIAGFRQVKGTAVYTAAFTPPTSPPTAITNTKLLLNFTNGAIYDNAMMNDLETVGNAQISTSVKKYGTGSLAFDGTGDYLTTNAGSIGAFGTGDFTIEMWVYFNNLTDYQYLIDFRPDTTNGAYITLQTLTGSNNIILYANSGTQITSATNSISAGSWIHVALCRASGSTRLFINGTQSGSTYADTTNYLVGPRNPVIAANAYTLGTYCVNGYIDDLRITKGYARYTTTFTPPTQAFSNTGPT